MFVQQCYIHIHCYFQGFVYSLETESCYLLGNKRMKRAEAAEACQIYHTGGHLVAIESQQEFDFIREQIKGMDDDIIL